MLPKPRMYCSQYVLRFTDQHRTLRILQRRQARWPHERSNAPRPLVPDDEQLNRTRILGKKVQGIAVDGGRAHVKIGVALLPLGEAAVQLRAREPIAFGDSVAVMNVSEA